MRPRVLNAVLTHQRADAVENLTAWWTQCVPAENLLLVLTGEAGDQGAVTHPQRTCLHDPRLRTRDHPRERQSYSAVFSAVAQWLRENDATIPGIDDVAGSPARFSHVHFAEYDNLPLTAELPDRQLAALAAEKADVLGFGVQRIDGTNHAHYLHHAADPAFAAFWRRLSCRADRGVVLAMLGCGTFWTRRAFEAVAGVSEPFPVYLELWLPTLAHHLGFRVRPFRGQDATGWLRHNGSFAADDIAKARDAGAWTIHPVKQLPHFAGRDRPQQPGD